MSSSAKSTNAPDGANHSIGRILVADDQPANIQIIGNVLGKLGYEIIPAPDGATALKRLALRLPDLILLDVLMPGMDGIEVCKRIQENEEWKHIPVIFLSAADDKELIVRALESGGVDYVTKPFNQAEMLSRVRTHLALKAARDQLKQLAEDKDELLGILAHDLKNHLGGMQMSANLLRERMTQSHDTRPAQLCDNICRSTSQLLVFVKDFLANCAADHGIVIKAESVDLCSVVSRAVEDYQEAAHRKQLEIVTNYPPDAVLATGDWHALVQVVDNLLSNAVKFSPMHTQITLTVRTSGSFVECIITDQGPGLTDNDKALMFRRYGRLSARPTGGEPSTGLGLSIVKKLITAMKAEILCDSTPGQGTTFTIRLPNAVNSQ